MDCKKIITVIAAALFCTVFLPTESPAGLDPRNNFGGVYDENEYKEVIFITGEPVMLTGTISGGDGNGETSSVSYSLENEDKGIELSRSVSYSNEIKEKDGQTITVTDITSFSESIDTPEASYDLVDHNFSRSEILDDKPAVDYFTGDWNGRKIYEVDNGGEVVVSVQGQNVGFENVWGSTETQQISGSITFEGEKTVGEQVYSDEWSGTFDIKSTYNTVKDTRYRENIPNEISFPGGYILVRDTNHYTNYNCRLPVMENGISTSSWNRDSGSYKAENLTTYERLPVQKVRDIDGHWAEDAVRRLYGLEVFESGQYFGPNVPMTRAEFSRALARILDMVEETEDEDEEEEQQERQIELPWDLGGDEEEENEEDEIMFYDVEEDHPFYDAITAVTENDILNGTGSGNFSPGGKLTRAQAIATFIRSLGFEDLNPNSVNRFADDNAIPRWAKDSVYIAAHIGLVEGDQYGYVKPNEQMSRGEAAEILHRYVNYLRHDLRTEYRDKIIDFR